MKIPVLYVNGYRPDWIVTAFQNLGHESRIMLHDEYYSCNPDDYDLFYGWDTSETGVDYRRASKAHLKKTCAFYGDSRFNYRLREDRFGTGDDKLARLISDAGGWVFQSQVPDLARQPDIRQSHLPFAADIHRWTNLPKETKLHNLSFVGNCYDDGRGAALNYALDNLFLYWPGPWGAEHEAASKIYRESWVAFHAPTFWNKPHDVLGTRVDYDVTMRYYEAAASGTPVITPRLPHFDAVGLEDGFQIFIYNDLSDMRDVFQRARQAAIDGGDDYSNRIRAWAEANSYEVRMQQALDVLRKNGVIP